ncbi:MAG: LAO/AO transport system kinase [Rhodothermales bacterium]|jgi:LAO/AO transport system kinase
MADHRKESSQRLGSASGARNPALSKSVRTAPSLDALVAGVRGGNRALLGQALSLVESSLATDQERASALLSTIDAPADNATLRVAISGAPGSGKSTLIDALGIWLTSAGHHVAVLAIDPTSARTGGSILGDKTRMPRLAVDDMAFIRPSPTSGMLGGVARATRPAIAVLEAAGYDIILLETVGVGQSETAARDMSDFFLLLSLAGAGDELQGIKRGIVEVADAVAVTKADGDNREPAAAAASRLRSALRLFPQDASGWRPRVMTCSATESEGLQDIWTAVSDYRETTVETGFWSNRRRIQQLQWFDEEVRARRAASEADTLTVVRRQLREDVGSGKKHPFLAAGEFMSALGASR